MEVILDGNKILNLNEFHEELKNKLHLPHFYGDNLDSLWDCLTGEIDLPIIIKWQNISISKQALGKSSELLISILKDAENELGSENFKFIEE